MAKEIPKNASPRRFHSNLEVGPIISTLGYTNCLPKNKGNYIVDGETSRATSCARPRARLGQHCTFATEQMKVISSGSTPAKLFSDEIRKSKALCALTEPPCLTRTISLKPSHYARRNYQPSWSDYQRSCGNLQSSELVLGSSENLF